MNPEVVNEQNETTQRPMDLEAFHSNVEEMMVLDDLYNALERARRHDKCHDGKLFTRINSPLHPLIDNVYNARQICRAFISSGAISKD